MLFLEYILIICRIFAGKMLVYVFILTRYTTCVNFLAPVQESILMPAAIQSSYRQRIQSALTIAHHSEVHWCLAWWAVNLQKVLSMQNICEMEKMKPCSETAYTAPQPPGRESKNNIP